MAGKIERSFMLEPERESKVTGKNINEISLGMRFIRFEGRTSLIDDPRGQATAEFAMVLPFLLLIFLLLAQAVTVMRAQIAVTAAAREGARKGVETGNVALIEGAAARAAAGLDQDKLRVAVESGPRRRGEWIRVEVEYQVPVVIPAVERFFPEVTVRGRAEMRIENDREESGTLVLPERDLCRPRSAPVSEGSRRFQEGHGRRGGTTVLCSGKEVDGAASG